MKKIVRIELLIVVLVGIGAVLYGIFYTVPDDLLQLKSREYDPTEIDFHPFWNYTFIKVYKAIFLLVLFLCLQNYIKAKYTWVGKALIIMTLIISSSGFIVLELLYNHTIDSEVLSPYARALTDLNVFFELVYIPLQPEYFSELTVLNSIQFIVVALVFLSLYFFLRQLVTLYKDSTKYFFLKNRKDLTYIAIGSFILVFSFILYNVITLPFFSISFIVQGTLTIVALSASLSFNVFWVYRKDNSFNFVSKTGYSLIAHLYLGAVITAIMFAMKEVSSPSLGLRASLQFFMITLIVAFFLVVISNVIGVPYYLIRKKSISENAQLLKQISANNAELSLLKSQINPHFLFNSLNTVYGLALEEKSPKSAEGVQKLSDMMRFMLQENTTDKIPLDREIKYIHDYIDFQLLRIDNKENINVSIDITDECKGQIAPMLLIPMIENAFKHGISMNARSWAKIVLSCNETEVSLNVKNSIHPKTKRKVEKGGIGLENVRKRLVILYPQKHLFQLFENESEFEANIKVTLS